MLDIRDHGGDYSGGSKERWIYDMPNLGTIQSDNVLLNPDSTLAAGVPRLAYAYPSSTPLAFLGNYYGVFADQSSPTNYFVGRYTKALQRVQEIYRYTATILFEKGLKIFKTRNRMVLAGINGSSASLHMFSIGADGTITSIGAASTFSANSSGEYGLAFDEARDRIYLYKASTKLLYVYPISTFQNNQSPLAVFTLTNFTNTSFGMFDVLDDGKILLTTGTQAFTYTVSPSLTMHGYVTVPTFQTMLHSDLTHYYVADQGVNIHKLDKNLNLIGSIPLSGAYSFLTIHELKGKGFLMIRYYDAYMLYMVNTRTFTLSTMIFPNVHTGALSSNLLTAYRHDTNKSFILDEDRNKLVYVGNYRSIYSSQSMMYYKASEYSLKF